MGDRSSDSYISGTTISYTVPDEIWTVHAGVVVVSTEDLAVSSSQAGSHLFNSGYLFSGGASAVRFLSTNGEIVNAAGAQIIGMQIGIDSVYSATSITNHGTIAGYEFDGIEFGAASDNSVLTNDGDIFGHIRGVDVENVGGVSNTAGVTIHNSGLIHSDQVGVHVGIESGLTVIIDNQVGGIIRGPLGGAVLVDSGNVAIDNRGTLDGGIDCNAASDGDVVNNRGKIIGEVHLGGGADSFSGFKGTSGAIFGEAGDDTLTGSSHNDSLNGGTGKDGLRGAVGADKFVFNDVLDSVLGASHDSILDFNHAQHDKIDLHLIDAIPGGLDDKFHFIAAKGFHGVAGELRYKGHLLQGDTTGDGIADFEIHVNAAHLVKGDFIL